MTAKLNQRVKSLVESIVESRLQPLGQQLTQDIEKCRRTGTKLLHRRMLSQLRKQFLIQ